MSRGVPGPLFVPRETIMGVGMRIELITTKIVTSSTGMLEEVRLEFGKDEKRSR